MNDFNKFIKRYKIKMDCKCRWTRFYRFSFGAFWPSSLVFILLLLCLRLMILLKRSLCLRILAGTLFTLLFLSRSMRNFFTSLSFFSTITDCWQAGCLTSNRLEKNVFDWIRRIFCLILVLIWLWAYRLRACDRNRL
jgi:hypothetical protein